MARSARFLSFRVAHANARGSFREHDFKKFVQMQKYLLAGFGNPCDVAPRSSGIARNPHNENKEIREDQLAFTILNINLLPLFAFTYFVVLPVSLTYVVEWIIRYWFR